MEHISNSVPDIFKPLLIGSARDVLRYAKTLISSTPPNEQKKLLDNDMFCLFVNSALFNLDSERRSAAIQIIATFDKGAQKYASLTFIGEQN